MPKANQDVSPKTTKQPDTITRLFTTNDFLTSESQAYRVVEAAVHPSSAAEKVSQKADIIFTVSTLMLTQA